MKPYLQNLQLLFQSKQYDLTISECEKVLAINENCIETKKLIAKSLIQTQKWNDSIPYLEEIISTDKKDYSTIKDLGLVNYLVGNKKKAINFFELSLSINQNFSPSLYLLSRLMLESGNIKKGEQLLLKLTTDNHDIINAFIDLSAVYKNTKRIKQAEEILRKGVEKYPNSYEINIRLGALLHALANHKESINFIQKSIDINPNSFESFFKLANVLISQKKTPEAEKALRKVISIKPDFPQAYLLLGIIMYHKKNITTALDLFNKAIKINPSFAEAYNNLGSIQKEQGDYFDAEHSIRKAIDINPDICEPYNNLGSVLHKQGRLKEAEKIIKKSIKIKANNCMAYLNLGAVLMDQGRLEEAETAIKQSIKLNPNIGMAYANLSQIENFKGDKTASANLLKIAFDLDSENEAIIWKISEYFYLSSQYLTAINYLKKSQSNRCQTLLLGCLLSLDREKEFHEISKKLLSKKLCNAELGGIIEHANYIYDQKIKSPFCSNTFKYVYIDQVNESMLSEKDIQHLISFVENENTSLKSQSNLKKGKQTSGNLFALNEPYIQNMKDALITKIEMYKESHKNSGEGFIQNWPKKYILSAWMISMNTGGFLEQHNHGYGWITGSFYLQVPKNKNIKDNGGSIAFSLNGPNYPTKDKKFATKIQNINKRDLVLFPSSLFHYTIPFESIEKRICFVFDLMPA